MRSAVVLAGGGGVCTRRVLRHRAGPSSLLPLERCARADRLQCARIRYPRGETSPMSTAAEGPPRAPARAVHDRAPRRRLRWLLGAALLAPLLAELALRAVGGDVVPVAPGPYDCSL